MPNKIINYKGIYYWDTHKDASKYAHTHGHTKIVKHWLGYAIQVTRYSSPSEGQPYVGDDFNHGVLNAVNLGPTKNFKKISQGCWLIED